MGLRKIFAICLMLILMPLTSFGEWQSPIEIITGNWGSSDRDFGIEKGDTTDRLPELTAILFDGKIIISDQVNEREAVYKSDGSLLKVVQWEIIQNGQKVTNPEFSLYHYWNVQGYTSDENIWVKFDDYVLVKPSTGETLKTSTQRPLELGVISEMPLANGQYKVTVKYPDKEWSIVGKGAVPKYTRDINGNLYGSGARQAIRYSYCGKELARLTMPKANIQEISRGEQLDPKINVLEEYGSPVVAPSGDVYTWKRTPDKYSILKWTWVDDPNVPSGPDAPTGLTVVPSTTGLYLTWTASPQDPGCVTGYEIARATSAGGVYSTVMTVDKGVVKYNDTSASAGTTYYYKVRAKAGSEYSAYTAEVSGKR